MKFNAAEVAAKAMKTGLSQAAWARWPLYFSVDTINKTTALPNPRCHGSQQVQTSSVVVIVESRSSEQQSVNTNLVPQDWSCELLNDWQSEKNKQLSVSIYEHNCKG